MGETKTRQRSLYTREGRGAREGEEIQRQPHSLKAHVVSLELPGKLNTPLYP